MEQLLSIGLWLVTRMADGNPQMQAVCVEVARLYQTAGEEVPSMLRTFVKRDEPAPAGPHMT